MQRDNVSRLIEIIAYKASDGTVNKSVERPNRTRMNPRHSVRGSMRRAPRLRNASKKKKNQFSGGSPVCTREHRNGRQGGARCLHIACVKVAATRNAPLVDR